jgi:hypothetical protein
LVVLGGITGPRTGGRRKEEEEKFPEEILDTFLEVRMDIC